MNPTKTDVSIHDVSKVITETEPFWFPDGRSFQVRRLKVYDRRGLLCTEITLYADATPPALIDVGEVRGKTNEEPAKAA